MNVNLTIGQFRAGFQTKPTEAFANDLTEIIRVARHRDGSTASIQASSATLAFLEAAADGHPEIRAELKRVGLDLSNIRFGNHPAAPGVLPTGGPNQRAVGPAYTAPPSRTVPARQVTRPVTQVPPAHSILAGTPLSGHATLEREYWAGNVSADFEAGTVKFGSIVLSLTQALSVLDALTVAIRKMLLPVEGCQWVNDLYDPLKSSSLVVLDSYLAEGLPEFDGGGALLAQIVQSEDGQYRGKLYNRAGGSVLLQAVLDMNSAKFAAAERVRPELQRLAAR